MSDVRSRKPLTQPKYAYICGCQFFPPAAFPTRMATDRIYLHSVDLHSFRISCVITSVQCVRMHLDLCIEQATPTTEWVMPFSILIGHYVLHKCKRDEWKKGKEKKRRKPCINDNNNIYIVQFVYRERSINIKNGKTRSTRSTHSTVYEKKKIIAAPATPSIAEAIMKWLMNRPVICRHFAFHSTQTHTNNFSWLIFSHLSRAHLWLSFPISILLATTNRFIRYRQRQFELAHGLLLADTSVMWSSSPHGGVTHSVSLTSRPMHNGSATLMSIFTQLIKVLFSLILNRFFHCSQMYASTYAGAKHTPHTLRTYLSNSNQCPCTSFHAWLIIIAWTDFAQQHQP